MHYYPMLIKFLHINLCSRMLTPRIESIINEEKNQGKIEMAKIDIDE